MEFLHQNLGDEMNLKIGVIYPILLVVPTEVHEP